MSIQQNFQKTVLASKVSSSLAQNIAFLSEDTKFWNDLLTNEEKEINFYISFSKSFKSKSIKAEQDQDFFKIYIYLNTADFFNFINEGKIYLFKLLYEHYQNIYFSFLRCASNCSTVHLTLTTLQHITGTW